MGSVERGPQYDIGFDKERIRSAALEYRGDRFEDVNHGFAFLKLQEKYPNAKRGEEGGVKEGFVTTHDRFVDREEAEHIADTAEQKRTKDTGRKELYSEDLDLSRAHL